MRAPVDNRREIVNQQQSMGELLYRIDRICAGHAAAWCKSRKRPYRETLRQRKGRNENAENLNLQRSAQPAPRKSF